MKITVKPMKTLNSILTVVLVSFAILLWTFTPTQEAVAAPDCEPGLCVPVYGCPNGLQPCAAHMCENGSWQYCWKQYF